MQITQNAWNLLASFPNKEPNSELAEIWSEAEQRIEEQNNHKRNIRQFRQNEIRQEDKVIVKADHNL